MILDTGPLRELLAYRAVTQLGFKKLERELNHLHDEERYGRCSDFLAAFRKKTTAAGVIVELGTWIRSTDFGGRLLLWALLCDEFRRMGMDEHSVALLDMPIGEVAKHGPTDISLLHHARENVRHKPVVLTIDTQLWSACYGVPVEAKTLQQITELDS